MWLWRPAPATACLLQNDLRFDEELHSLSASVRPAHTTACACGVWV